MECRVRVGGVAILCAGGLDVIRKEAWPFYRTISGVRLCWELEEPKGPEGRSADRRRCAAERQGAAVVGREVRPECGREKAARGRGYRGQVVPAGEVVEALEINGSGEALALAKAEALALVKAQRCVLRANEPLEMCHSPECTDMKRTTPSSAGVPRS